MPAADRDGDLSAAYSRLLHDPEPAVRERAALAWCEWCEWEDVHVSLARVVTHYWGNGCFLPDGQLLREAGRLAGIPGVMVHGRLDVSGPLDTAWAMRRAWPDRELVVIGDAGHSGGSMSEALVAATDRFVDRR